MLNSSIVISPLVLFCFVLFSGKVNKAVRRTYHIFLPIQEPPRTGTLCDFTENSLHRPEMKTTLVKSTFLKAFESRNQPVGLTFHSDQGTQYTAFEFRKLLRKLGVRQSLSNPGTPHDNAVAEAFFSILKREELSHNWYNTPEDLENTLQEYRASLFIRG